MALAGSAAKVFCVVGNAHTLYGMRCGQPGTNGVYERACVMRQLPTVLVYHNGSIATVGNSTYSTTSTIQFTIAYMIVGTGTSTIADSRDVYLDRSLSTTTAVVATSSTTW